VLVNSPRFFGAAYEHLGDHPGVQRFWKTVLLHCGSRRTWQNPLLFLSRICAPGITLGRQPHDSLDASLLCARSFLALHRGTLYRTVGTKDAAVAPLGAKDRFTVDALVEELTGVAWHRFKPGEAANWTHQHGFKNNFAHVRAIRLSTKTATIKNLSRWAF